FSQMAGAVGSFTWGGVWGTYFWIDPAEKLVGLQMIQVAPQDTGTYSAAIRHLAYAALKTPGADSIALIPSPPNVRAGTLSAYVGKYYFGSSLSPSDRQSPARGVFGGVGLNIAKEAGLLKVTPLEGAPAAKAGVMSGDIVTHVDASPVADLGIDQIISKLRG